MPSLHDLSDNAIPLDRRLALALEFAIGALNDAPAFGTHIVSPDTGRPLSSYRVLAKLDPVLAEAKAAFVDPNAQDRPAMAQTRSPATDKQSAVTAKAMLILYDLLKGQPLPVAQSPASVMSDLMMDLIRYANREGADFSDALAIAYSRIAAECPGDLAPNHER